MAVTASTDALRKDLTAWLESQLIAGGGMMAFGCGGVDDDGKALAVDAASLELTDQRAQYPLHAWTRQSDTTIVVTGRLPPGGLVGIPVSQAGFKVGSRLYAVRNFSAKTFEVDEYFDVNIEIEF